MYFNYYINCFKHPGGIILNFLNFENRQFALNHLELSFVCFKGLLKYYVRRLHLVGPFLRPAIGQWAFAGWRAWKYADHTVSGTVRTFSSTDERKYEGEGSKGGNPLELKQQLNQSCLGYPGGVSFSLQLFRQPEAGLRRTTSFSRVGNSKRCLRK